MKIKFKGNDGIWMAMKYYFFILLIIIVICVAAFYVGYILYFLFTTPYN